MAKKIEKWYRLDNAAKIYPVSKSRSWQAIFRLSCDLTETVDPELLERALARTIKRFPLLSVRLRRGAFWYYFEHIDGFPPIVPDSRNPCTLIKPHENEGFCFRVKYYENRIAVEFFHVLTDGSGGLSFLETLTAEYLELAHDIKIPRAGALRCVDDPPTEAEAEDSFLVHAKDVALGRKETNAWQLRGSPETDGYLNITTATISSEQLLTKARECNVTLTEYLAASMILSLAELYSENSPRKPADIKVSIPVSLRRFFGSETLRNFSSYINVGIDPRMGEFTFEEILHTIRHQLELELTTKRLCARFSANVRDERAFALRIAPLFLKYVVLKLAYLSIGERKITTTLSNLGVVSLPEAMKKYVTRFDLILGSPNTNAVNCAAVSYNGKLFFNVTRRIREPLFERKFFTSLVRRGLHVLIESNRGE